MAEMYASGVATSCAPDSARGTTATAIRRSSAPVSRGGVARARAVSLGRSHPRLRRAPGGVVRARAASGGQSRPRPRGVPGRSRPRWRLSDGPFPLGPASPRAAVPADADVLAGPFRYVSAPKKLVIT